MQDRVSLYPGRVKLVPVAGQENTYDMVRADSPTQDGTPLNKASLLKDTTAALFGLDEAAVPDDVFSMLFNCFAQIFVMTTPNTQVTASLNGKTVSTTSDSSGNAVLKVSEFGAWTVTAGSTSKTVNVNAIAVFYLVMVNLESLSWPQISMISKNGQASSLFNIGDEKTLTVNGVSYTAVIIGFDHDTPADIASYGRGKAGITWQLKNCLTTVYNMNNSATNDGGWANCTMRSSTMTTLLNQLTSDLKNSIVKVKKLTSNGNKSTTITTTEDYLFLLSEIEVSGSIYQSVKGEGIQYEYYQAGNSTQKDRSWWERSPASANATNFCYIQGGGYSTDNARYYNGVSFAFCI